MNFSHDAFISYSHSTDGETAAAIERGLEKLAKPLLKLRAMDVFRDESSLAASSSLWPEIVKHLGGSQWFILIASPTSAGSNWCNKEAIWWLDNRPQERFLIVVTDGDVVWGESIKEFDLNRTTAISQVVSKRFAQEPHYIDMRWIGEKPDLTLGNLRFRDAIVSIAAPLRGVRKDYLDSADLKQLRRNRFLVHIGVGTIAVTAALAVWQAIESTQQRIVAESERDSALARLLAIRAEKFAPSELSVLLAIESLRTKRFAETDSLLRRLIRLRPILHKSVSIPEATSGDTISLSYSPHGKYVIAAGTIDTAILWNSKTLEEVARFKHPRGSTYRLSPNEQYLATVVNGNVVLHDLVSSKTKALTSGIKGGLLAFSPDSSLIAIGQFSNYTDGHPWKDLLVHSVLEGKRIGVATTKGGGIDKVGFSPDGRYLAVTRGSTVSLWNLTTGFQSPHAEIDSVHRWLFDPISGGLLLQKQDRSLRGYRLETATTPNSWNLKAVQAFSVSQDGSHLATVQDGVIKIRGRDVETPTRLPGASPEPVQLKFLDRSRKLLVTGGGTRVFSIQPPKAIAAMDRKRVAWSPDGDFVATIERSGNQSTHIHLWQVKGGEIAPPIQHDEEACTVAFNGEGDQILTTSHDRTARVWNASNGREIARTNHGSPVTAAWFSPDGTTIVSAGRGEARWWRIDEPKKVSKLHYSSELSTYFRFHQGCGEPNTIATAFLENDVLVAVATSGSIAEVWSFRTGKKLMTVDHKWDEDRLRHDNNLRVAINSDGKVLATINANKDGPVRLWKIPNGDPIQKLQSIADASNSSITYTQWRKPHSADGRYVVQPRKLMGPKNPLVRETKLNRAYVELVDHPKIHGSAFSPDGRTLATASSDGSIRLYLMAPNDILEAACKRVARNLTLKEWQSYVGSQAYRQACEAGESG